MNKYVLILSILFLVSCKNKIENVERAFYYWKSNEWSFSDKEKAVFDSLKIDKLYVKFFEVDYNNELGSYPISKTSFSYWTLNNIKLKSIIPTVYLKNIVFLKSSKKDIDALADNVNFLINKYQQDKFKDFQIDEFQIDCDWTPNSKENYFYFLKKIKSISGKQISVTLRLYPFKYQQKMGVPPADKVTLMCYNLLNALENKNKNSILEVNELKKYLKNADTYPKHLDIALPIYSWAQVYHNEQFSDIIYTNTKNIKSIVKQEKEFWYSVTKDTVINNTYLRIGDKIKSEEINATIIKNAIALLKQYIVFDKNTTVALFHLDEEQLNNYTNEELSSFYTDFSK